MFAIPSSSRTVLQPLVPLLRVRPAPRLFHTTPLRSLPADSPLSRPRPPALPKADQEEFERLLKSANSVGGTLAESGAAETSGAEEQHPDLRRQPKPDFEGDTNPKTGEVGGPKRDPFSLGGGDWQFGGRVTDF